MMKCLNLWTYAALLGIILFGGMHLVGAEPKRGPSRYPIGDHGWLVLPVPHGWQEKALPLREPPSVTLKLSRIGGAAEAKFTAAFLPPAKSRSLTPGDMRADVERTGQQLLSGSVEKTLVIRDMKGKHALGYYYSLTDRSYGDKDPPPGEFKHMTQGILRTGDVLIAFTIFPKAVDDNAAMLQMLTNAEHLP